MTNPRAFTLIELLVVISVIALLLAILMPCLQRVRKQAKAVGCQANLRQSGLYFAAHVAEDDGKFNLGKKGTNLPSDLYFTIVVAGPSCERRDLLLCPMASRMKSMPEFAGPFWESFGITGAPGDTFSAWSIACRRVEGGFDLYVGSYGLSVCATNEGHSGWGPAHAVGATTDVRETPRIPVYLDCLGPSLVPANPNAEPPPYEGYCGSDNAYSSLSPSVINRHGGSVNCLFMDWSGRKVGLKEIWTLKWMREWNTAGPWTKRGGVKPEDWPQWMHRFKDY